MHPSYLNTLKAFVEGQKDLREWPAWWQETAHLIEEIEGHMRYLKIKLEWRAGACQILEHHGITYQANASVNWDRCKGCGEPLFHARPHETTKEQIREFARTSNLPDKEEVEQEGWIHPGTYCPNDCTEVLITYRGDAANDLNRKYQNE
jgi:hypothetical protein